MWFLESANDRKNWRIADAEFQKRCLQDLLRRAMRWEDRWGLKISQEKNVKYVQLGWN